MQPRAAPVKAGINLPNCNFGLSLRSRMELVYQGKEVRKGPIVLKKSEYLLERYNIPRPLCAITNPLTKNAHAVYGVRYSSDEVKQSTRYCRRTQEDYQGNHKMVRR